jgi:dephospho-CoA kinase
MKLCGLTGGVGMGKSTAAGFLLQAGAKVIDTDVIAREIVQPGQPALKEIEQAFGPDIISTQGELKRDQLANLVFADPSARQRLEAILHPRIRAQWHAQIEKWRHEQCTLAVVVIPLLFETQAEAEFDKILCVACSPGEQLARLRARGWTDTQSRQRIASQLSVDQKIARSHYVIWTEGSPHVYQAQITRILGQIG